MRNLPVAALLVALAVACPAVRAEQINPQTHSLRATIKAKYLERRARFMQRVKDAYFAMGCKILAREAGILPLTSSESYLAYIGDQTIVDLKDDENLRQAAMQEGLDRAARPGECDYYRRHPQAAEAIRRAAADAATKH